MKRSPLLRRTPLVNRTPMKATRPKPAVPNTVRASIAERSGGWCEMALMGCAGLATQVHHRITQKAGGRQGAAKARHDRPANLLHACDQCHAWVTARPAEAYDVGLSLKEWQDPTAEPVIRRGVLVYLDDEYGIHDYEEVGA
jgi:hypothetical protein